MMTGGGGVVKGEINGMSTFRYRYCTMHFTASFSVEHRIARYVIVAVQFILYALYILGLTHFMSLKSPLL
jgi:hypothetical protein